MTRRRSAPDVVGVLLSRESSVDDRNGEVAGSGETSLDSPSDDLSDSSSSHSSFDNSLPALPSGMRFSYHLCSLAPSIPRSPATAERPSYSSVASPSRKRSRSPTTSVPRSSPILGALSPTRADILPPPKRIRSSDFVIDLEDHLDESFESSVPKETSLRDDVVVRGSDEPHLEQDINPEIQAEIDEWIAALEVTYETLGDLIQRFHDHTEEIPICRVQAIKGVQRDQGHMIVATGQQSVVRSERISELERDNMRLRGTLDVVSQRVSRLQQKELRVSREMRQIQLYCRTMTNTRSGATMTREAINELIVRRVAKVLEARDATRNLEPLVEGGCEKEDKNGGNGNGGVNGNGGNGNRGGNDNENGNGHGRGNGHNFRGLVLVARECTYNFNGT
nr:hypothetical protein [Tanacetum cinerariifolium]